MIRTFAAAALLVSLAGTVQAQPTGQSLYNLQCRGCHSSPVMAPALNGIAGAKIASKPGYAYSAGLKAKASQKWTDANLDAFLKAPTTFAAGTKMMVGVANDASRKAIIEHLKTLK